MAMGFTVQHDDENYRIVGPGGEEGEVTNIGSPAFLEIRGQTYMSFLDVDPDGQDGEPPDPDAQTDPITAHVYLLGPRQVTEFQVVEFEGLGEEGEEEEGDEEDGEDEDEGDEDEEDIVEVEENKGE